MGEVTHVVRFMGGIGNQLFEYALYRTFAEQGCAVRGDLSFFAQDPLGRAYQLPLLGIEVAPASPAEIRRLARPRNFFKKALRYCLGRKTWFRPKELYFDPAVLAAKRGYFDGYWQSPKYFAGHEDQIRASVKFPDVASPLAERIAGDPAAVSVHVRLGDYLKFSAIFGGICTPAYYRKAMKTVAAMMAARGEGEPHFYVFSNDVAMAKEILDDDRLVFVEGHSEAEGHKDLYLMSLCRHHVVANSSFSWWGAFLRETPATIVVAPSRWLNGMRDDDVVPDRWLRIAGD